VLGCFLVGLFVPGVVMAQKKPVILRLVVPSPAGDWPLTFSNMELARRFNERAKGEYKIEVHAGGALAKLPEYFDAVRVGAVEMACAPWGMFSSLDPRLGIIETPFLFSNSPATSAAGPRLLPLYDQILQEKFNAKGLALFNPGGVNLFSTKPVKTLNDWKGLLVGALSPTASALAKELGASPVTVMWTDTYESLQKKVIDATLQGSHGAVAMNMIDVCKHATFFYGLSGWNGFSINLDTWKKMPKHIQTILQEEASAAGEWVSKTTDGEEVDVDLKAYKDKGVAVYFVPKEERDRWEKVVAPYKEKMLAEAGEFGAKVKKIAEEVNKTHPYSQRGMH
jgi:TRAP-type C4-dicarboxylate transport system substrate-binding protein